MTAVEEVTAKNHGNERFRKFSPAPMTLSPENGINHMARWE